MSDLSYNDRIVLLTEKIHLAEPSPWLNAMVACAEEHGWTRYRIKDGTAQGVVDYDDGGHGEWLALSDTTLPMPLVGTLELLAKRVISNCAWLDFITYHDNGTWGVAYEGNNPHRVTANSLHLAAARAACLVGLADRPGEMLAADHMLEE